MGFSGNFTGVTLGEDERGGGRALFVEGRTDASEIPDAIHVVLPRDGELLSAAVEAPGLTDWEAKFPEGAAPFTVGDDVFIIGVAKRHEPQEPFVWQGSFTITAREFP
jgi:hypothetical protein